MIETGSAGFAAAATGTPKLLLTDSGRQVFATCCRTASSSQQVKGDRRKRGHDVSGGPGQMAGIKGRRRGAPLEPLGRSPLLRLGKSHDGILHRAHSGARGWNASRSVCRRSSRRPAGDVRVRRSIDDSRFLAPRPTSALSDIGALLLIEQWAEAHVRK